MASQSASTYTSMRSVNPLLFKGSLLAMVVGPFLAVILAIVLTWQQFIHPSDLILFGVMYAFIALGVTVGFHRMLTHRSFKPHPVVKFLLLVLGSMAFEGPALEWTATHVKHHAQSDKEGDPHSPVEGFWHAHLGWLFKGGLEDPKAWAPYLLNDKMVVFVSKTFLLWGMLSLVIPLVAGFLIGGWPLALSGLLWGGFVRMFFTHHVTWSVNSVCHTFGKRPFQTTDQSRNEWIVGLLGFGEGWHNNHHAFPRSAFHGLRWWQFDLSGYLIWTLEKLGLVSDVYRVTPAQLARRSRRSATVSPDELVKDEAA
jgi:stearoyl-CoA desaturase (Delta-9 desaturase)